MDDAQRLNRALDLIYSMKSISLLHEVERAAVMRARVLDELRDEDEEDDDESDPAEFNWDYLSS